LLLGLLTVFALGAAVLGLRGGLDGPAPAPVPTPTPSLSPYVSPPPTPTASPAPVTALAFGALCDVVTDGRTTLTVSFSLVNTAAEPVRLARVTPLAPLGEPRPGRVTVRAGDCGRPGGPLTGDLVPARGRAVVAMDFALPPRCPRPYPIQAVVRELRDGRIGTLEVALLNDLGGYDFATC